MAKKHRSKKKGVADSETDPAAAGTAAAAELADAKPVDTIDWGALKADILAGSDGGEGAGLAAGKKGKREKRVTDKEMNVLCLECLSVCFLRLCLSKIAGNTCKEHVHRKMFFVGFNLTVNDSARQAEKD